MNTDLESGMLLAGNVADAIEDCEGCDVIIYPPFPYLQAIDSVITLSNLTLGAQNMWHEDEGAYTGEVSGSMLVELGVTSVLVGHSERRHVMCETNDLIAKKTSSGIKQQFQVVLCVGETLQEREAGNTLDVVLGQIKTGLADIDSSEMEGLVIAYEPVWAIGTGKTAKPEDAQTVHAAIRACVGKLFDDTIAQALRIQYGGSVKPENATDLFACPDIDGALVGGASLSSDTFSAIVSAACHT